MSSVAVFAGLDYHQDGVQACVLDETGRQLANRQVGNDGAAVAAALTRHGRPTRIAIEACCGAADLAEQLITRYGLPVTLAHPGYAARLKRTRDKSDLADARLLADLARVDYVPEVWLAPEETRQLRRLTRHRRQLMQRRTDVKLRIRGLLRENRLKCPLDANAWTKAWLGWLADDAPLAASDRLIVDDHLTELLCLNRRILAVERELKRRTADDPVVARLMAIPQIGLVTAATLRAEIGRFDRFDNGKQLARFCGVTPRNASSGQRQADAGLVKAGNPELRRVLIELAQRLVNRTEGRWAKLAGQMLGRGKKKNVVVAAIANRWVRRLYWDVQRVPLGEAVDENPVCDARAKRPAKKK